MIYSLAIAIRELVRTTLLTVPDAAAALRTFNVPSTAGLITSFSSLGLSTGSGLATCWTYVHPLTALN